jgi:hypothetical protein
LAKIHNGAVLSLINNLSDFDISKKNGKKQIGPRKPPDASAYYRSLLAIDLYQKSAIISKKRNLKTHKRK